MRDPKLRAYCNALMEKIRDDVWEALEDGRAWADGLEPIIQKLRELATSDEGAADASRSDPLPPDDRRDPYRGLLTYKVGRHMGLDALASIMASAAQTLEARGGDALLEILVRELRWYLTREMLEGAVIAHPENFR